MTTPGETREVPLLDAAGLVKWLYNGSVRIQVAVEGHRYVTLPAPEQFAELLAVAQGQGFEWVLMDGPRQMRPSWVLDPWWSERPEMSPKILQNTRAGCLQSVHLRDALIALSA